MSRARAKPKRRTAGNSNGSFDAFHALELEQIEEIMRDPDIRDLLKRQTREMLQAMISKMGK